MAKFYIDYAAAAFEFYLKTDRDNLKNEAEARDWQAAARTIEGLEPERYELLKKVFIDRVKPFGNEHGRLRGIYQIFCLKRGLRFNACHKRGIAQEI